MGVDPGNSGAIAFYNYKTKELHEVIDMPTRETKAGSRGKMVDGTEITHVMFGRFIHLAVIEDVGGRPNDGPIQAFRFGEATGIAIGCIQSMGIPLQFVKPEIWKHLTGLTRDKDLSRARAVATFPKHASLFKRKKDDGRAEAALLAKFGARFLGVLT